ncbi:DUF6879 family protein [Cryptosporangium sp. NPDC051539]|uniref:DUF6879 family protein n=1 Tax=Cryptosporangium sp. NPDC051539 TaxID=3363962 RepID=UPI0037B64E48
MSTDDLAGVFALAQREIVGVKAISRACPTRDAAAFRHWRVTRRLPPGWGDEWTTLVARTVQPPGGVPIRRLCLLPHGHTDYIDFLLCALEPVAAAGEDVRIGWLEDYGEQPGRRWIIDRRSTWKYTAQGLVETPADDLDARWITRVEATPTLKDHVRSFT